MKTSTYRSAWVKETTKYIDMIGNSYVIDITNKDLKLTQLTTRVYVSQ